MNTDSSPLSFRTRLSRIYSDRLTKPRSPAPVVSTPRIWAYSGWIGLVCGLAESGLHLGWRHLGPRVGDPDLWVNWNKPWLGPLALATYAIGVGILASFLHRVAPRTVIRIVPYVLIGLGFWSALGVIPGLNRWAVGLLCLGLSIRIGPYGRFDSASFRRFVRFSIPYIAVIWLAFLIGTGIVPAFSEAWGLATKPLAPTNAPNVLMVVLDTVRADNLGMYGYGRQTSPNLDTLAARGVRFESARATSPFTLGTHASLFTGCWMSQTSAGVSAPLDRKLPTIAEVLCDRGYATGGFVGNIFYGSAHYGLDRGFLHYHDIPGNITRRVTFREFLRSCQWGDTLVTYLERKWRIMAPMQRFRLDADELNREALAWVDQTRDQNRPYFLFLNYFDAHSPYSLPGDAPQPFARVSASALESMMKRLEKLEERQEQDPDPGVQTQLIELRDEVNSHLRDAYDDGIAWIDRKFAELLGDLERRGMLANTVVIVTADHGEMLGEHGLIGHGDSLHRQVVHVPLVVVGASGMKIPPSAVIPQPVSVRDVPATILGLLGTPEKGPLPGRSLERFWLGDPEVREPVLSEVEHMPWLARTPRKPVSFGPMWLLTDRRWSYRRQNHESLGMQEHLFDRENDSQEEHDLAGDPAFRATLEDQRARLEQAYATMAIPPRPGLDVRRGIGGAL